MAGDGHASRSPPRSPRTEPEPRDRRHGEGWFGGVLPAAVDLTGKTDQARPADAGGADVRKFSIQVGDGFTWCEENGGGGQHAQTPCRRSRSDAADLTCAGGDLTKPWRRQLLPRTGRSESTTSGRRAPRFGSPPVSSAGGLPAAYADAEHMFVRREATILHADLDASSRPSSSEMTAASRGRPIVVGMGVVLSASYEARAYGIRTAMGGRQARRLCPHVIAVTADVGLHRGEQGGLRGLRRHDAARRRAVDDEAFLDVRGLEHIRGTPTETRAAAERRRRARGTPDHRRVARTKFLAKVASGVAKPDGLLVVPPDGELAFLHPLPVERLWGVGHVTAGKLHGRDIRTVGQVAEILGGARTHAGRASGRHLRALADNLDPRPVEVGRRRGSIGSQHALGRRTPRTWEAVDVVVTGWSTASPGGCGRLGGSAAPSSCGCASTTSRA